MLLQHGQAEAIWDGHRKNLALVMILDRRSASKTVWMATLETFPDGKDIVKGGNGRRDVGCALRATAGRGATRPRALRF